MRRDINYYTFEWEMALNPIGHFWVPLKGYLRKRLPTASSALGEICKARRFFAEKRLNVK
jgi:hypothetical protein